VRVAFSLFCWALVEGAWSEAYYGARRVVVIPTADALASGDYQASLSCRVDKAKPWTVRETGIAFDFGLSDRLLARGVVTDAESISSSRVVEWDGRWVVVRSRGGVPGLAMGASGREESAPTRSLYATLTKDGNLPQVGFFRLHFGVRGEVRSPTRRRILPMAGIEKRWYRMGRQMRFGSDWDGESLRVGIEQIFRTGLHVGVAGLLYERAEREKVSPSVAVVVGFGNEEMRNEIENAKKLARQAARVASQNAEAPDAKEEGNR